MSKPGNEYLHYYFFEAANALRVHDAEYQASFETKLKEVTKEPERVFVFLLNILPQLS